MPRLIKSLTSQLTTRQEVRLYAMWAVGCAAIVLVAAALPFLLPNAYSPLQKWISIGFATLFCFLAFRFWEAKKSTKKRKANEEDNV